MSVHPWEKSYPPGLSWGDPLPPPVPLESYLEESAAKWPNGTAIDFYDRLLTFGELRDLAHRAAAGLQSLGVRPGSHVGLHLPNTPHYVACFFGALMAGATVVNFGPMTGPREFKHQLQDSGVSVMVTMSGTAFYPVVAPLVGTHDLKTLIVCDPEDFLDEGVISAVGMPRAKRQSVAGRQIDFAELVDNPGEFARPGHGDLEDEIAVLQYTGGTTGVPKGAMLTHANFSAAMNSLGKYQIGLIMSRQALFGDSASATVTTATAAPAMPKFVTVMPVSHIGGLLTGVIGSIAAGIHNVWYMRLDPARLLADIARKKISNLWAAPSVYSALIEHPSFAASDLSSVQGWSSGTAPIPSGLITRLQGAAGRWSSEQYGLTETTGVATMHLSPTGSAPAKTVGLPLPLTTIDIVDLETGSRVLGTGERGEICISGPQVMKGYWNDPESTKVALRDGRFHTGDIGFLDEGGFLHLLDRKKDMILTGGYNVYSSRVEHSIQQHPAVSEAAVVGVPHPYFGEVVKAFVVLRADSRRFTLSELHAFLSDKLSRNDMPQELEFRAALPRTPLGKVVKAELKSQEAAAASAAP